MTLAKDNLPSLEEIKTKLGRNNVKIAELTGISAAHVGRILKGQGNFSKKTYNNVIAAALSVINSDDNIVNNIEIEVSKNIQHTNIDKEELLAIIQTTAKQTAKETAEALGHYSELITRSDAIMQYFDGKQSRYENYMNRHKGEVSISKGVGRNATITLNRKELEQSFRKHKIAC